MTDEVRAPPAKSTLVAKHLCGPDMTDFRALHITETLRADGLAQTCVAQAAQSLRTSASGNESVGNVLVRRAMGLELCHQPELAKHLDRDALASQLIRYFETRREPSATQGKCSNVVIGVNINDEFRI